MPQPDRFPKEFPGLGLVGRYPARLGGDLLGGGLPWEAALEATMPNFLSRYTLQDSLWIGLYLQPKAEAVALVRWDTYWTDGGLPSAGNAVADWPVLLVRFERVYQTFTTYPGPEERETLSGLPETISDATSAALRPSERESLLDTILRARQEADAFSDFLLDDTLHRTTISPVYRSWVEIWHGGVTRFLCLDASGETVPIPDLR